MSKRRKNRKPMSNNKKIFNIIAVISTILAIVFGIMLYVLDMIPINIILLIIQ